MKNLKDSNQPSPAKIVLPDECGDSLWEETLGQNDDGPVIKKSDKKDAPARSADQKNNENDKPNPLS
jgi:hypothetical protein